MSTELNLRFPDAEHVIVRLGLDDEGSGQLAFTNPIADKDLRDIQWYVETYGAHSLGDPDDQQAKRIEKQLPAWGKALFDAVFQEREAQRLFNAFQDAEGDSRLLTISAEHPAILALPWELLHDSSAPDGTFLFHEQPSISIRRRVAGATGGRAPFKPAPKDSLHLLFVISRPEDAGFLDPRADSAPVLDAIDQHAPGRVTCEFLRPPTLDALNDRLNRKPPVDILHFDGHGVFDRHGNLPNRASAAQTARITRLEELLRDKKVEVPVDPDCPPNMGYLLFEKPDGQSDFVSADKLGANLHRHKVALVILSACQSAAVGVEGKDSAAAVEGEAPAGEKRPMGSVAARLTATGIPSVLAMTHSVLVHTTRALFGEFYKELARHKGIGEALDQARRHLANHPEKYEVQRGPNRVPLKLYDWFLPALYQQGADVALLKRPAPVGQTFLSAGSGDFPVARESAAPAGGGMPPAGLESLPMHREQAGKPALQPAGIRTNLPKAPEAGFFGRRRDLWHIERWFAGKTRRITITGFGGQGKTALAQEAGRWLTRAGLFQAAVFVDYSRVQAADAVAVAKNEIGRVLDQTFIDADAATVALKQTPTLVILDNLEALAPEPLRALLDAAVPWSEAGGSRVLCTTRRPDFGHAGYKVEGTLEHRRIVLDGLATKQAPDNALEWCAALMKLPPAPTVPAPRREALIELFDLPGVKFHPLSIRVLTQQLKTRRIAELGERLEQLLGGTGDSPVPRGDSPRGIAGRPAGAVDRPSIGCASPVPSGGSPDGTGGSPVLPKPDEDTPAGLLASLELSLDKLDAAAREVLPRLGVFQGGAMESRLLEITGLGDPYERRRSELQGRLTAAEARLVRLEADLEVPPGVLEQLKAKLREDLAKVPPPPVANLWPGLRRQLEAAALIEAEDIPGVTVPFLRFHPTLAPMLWARLDAAERERLAAAHRQRYYALSGYLYQEDRRNPHQARAIAWREQPNLLHAVHAALNAGDPDAGTFAEYLNKFLGFFGLKQEAESVSAKAQAGAGKAGSQAWVLAQSNRGEQLRTSGQVAGAAQVFQEILKKLSDTPTYERAATLGRLGRCFREGGRPDLAAQSASDAIAVCDKLGPSDNVKRHRGVMLTDKADALAEQGKFAEARQAYEDGLKVAEDLEDRRQQGVVLGQLGTLAMLEGKLAEALDRWRAALALFQQLREPTSEAVAWHQLGRVFEEAQQWDEAERHYRESARINEDRGDLAGAAGTWNQLAIVSESAGKPDAAELWYRKAIEVDRAMGNPKQLAPDLNNLADLLHTQPGRLAEARQLAEEALAIKQTLDPGAAGIWTTYSLLAEIAEKEATTTPDDRLKAGLQTQAREHRRLAREAKRNFAGTRHQLRRHAPLILSTVLAMQDRKQRKPLEEALPGLEHRGWTNLVAALRRILSGERDADSLCANLDFEDSMIIETILAGLADPSTLSDLLPPETS